MSPRTEKCSICGEKLSSIGMGSHKGSNNCYAKANGTKISEDAIIVSSGKRPDDVVCSICGEVIADDKEAVMLRKLLKSKWARIYIHFNHIKGDEDLMAELIDDMG